MNVIEGSDSPCRLYGASNNSSPTSFHRLTFDAEGISILDETPDLLPGGYSSGEIEFGHGLIFITRGMVIDPERGEIVGEFDLLAGDHPVASAYADSRNESVHFLTLSPADDTASDVPPQKLYQQE